MADMTGTSFTIDALLTGKAVPFGPSGRPSAIAKTPVDRPLALGREGLDGDEQGERKLHGGPEMPLHHYPFDHYAAWAAELGPLPLLDAPGAFGENLSTTGLTEADVCIGDVWRLGGALVQVNQGRQPCLKLNHRFGVRDMAKRVQESGRTGWYYRVLETGMVAPGDALTLQDRPHPAWSVARVLHVLYVDTMNRPELEEMAALERLTPPWRALARKRLEQGKVEGWGRRLGAG